MTKSDLEIVVDTVAMFVVVAVISWIFYFLGYSEEVIEILRCLIGGYSV